jgi:5'-deoxynucleotidase YfbR-like HD superfamily hydrolase
MKKTAFDVDKQTCSRCLPLGERLRRFRMANRIKQHAVASNLAVNHRGQAEAERVGAVRIFGILPEAQRDHLMLLWTEFEAAETPDAQFAKALDRMQPLLLNILTDGGTWTENGVTEHQVYYRYDPVIERGSSALWLHAQELVRTHFSKALTA